MFRKLGRAFRLPSIPLLFVVLQFLGTGTASAAEVIVLRSGNATVGNPDPNVTLLVGSGALPLSTLPFTADDFDAACDRTAAIVVQPHPAWAQGLECDPEARWIGTDVSGTPASALYCYEFEVETCCIAGATLDFCWATDDVLGDPTGNGPNPDAVFLNGVAVSPSIFGGNYATQTQSPTTDVTGLIQCGTNRLEVYNRDLGFVISGVIFSATVEVIECVVPVESSGWGAIKALYR